MIVDERNLARDQNRLLLAAGLELNVFLRMHAKVDGESGDGFRREALRFS